MSLSIAERNIMHQRMIALIQESREKHLFAVYLANAFQEPTIELSFGATWLDVINSHENSKMDDEEYLEFICDTFGEATPPFNEENIEIMKQAFAQTDVDFDIQQVW